MSKEIENPQAFPAMDMNNYNGVDVMELRYEGMSLRDYFAAKIISGLYASGKVTDTMEKISYQAYRTADAMLKARMLNNEND